MCVSEREEVSSGLGEYTLTDGGLGSCVCVNGPFTLTAAAASSFLSARPLCCYRKGISTVWFNTSNNLQLASTYFYLLFCRKNRSGAVYPLGAS